MPITREKLLMAKFKGTVVNVLEKASIFSRRLSYLLIILFIISNIIILPYGSFSQAVVNDDIIGKCNCVVFRMDDIQDYWIQEGQLAPMDIFISKNQSLTLGLIMNAIGNDEKIVNKVRHGSGSGLFELAINGWNTTDYTKLSQKEQQYSLELANQKMQMLFGNTSDIFIPPEGSFDNSTIKAMSRNNIEILSSSIYAEDNFNEGKSRVIADAGIANKTDGVFHLPNTISFKYYIGNKWIKNSIENILSNITQDLEKHGYSVIALRPQHFMKVDSNGNLTNSLDKGEVEDLSYLIDSILLRHINITSFSKIVGIEPRVYAYPASCGQLFTAVCNSNLNLRPSDPISLDGLVGLEYAMAEIYNTYGKYLYEKALQLGISPAAAAAVLYVESRGSGFGADGRMTIRFEACTFYDLWGKKNLKEFSNYFQCNAQNDKFRPSSISQFANYHGDHFQEWRVFEFARNLNEEAAMKSISMGLAQIMGFNYDKIGYGSVKEMFENMSNSIKSQLDAFFLALSYKDNNTGKSCLDNLKVNDYIAFAGCYNAAGQDYSYGSQIKGAVDIYKEITSGKLYA